MAGNVQIGDWLLDVETCRLQRGSESELLDPQPMRVLLQLAEAAPGLVTTEDLLAKSWPGVTVGDNVVHQAIRQLRRAFGDDARDPRVIETLARRGYRLIAPVAEVDRSVDGRAPARPRGWLALAAAACVAAMLVVATVWDGREQNPVAPVSAVAVLPFDDVSPGGDQAWLAHGMVVALTESLSRIEPLHVIGRTSTYRAYAAASDLAELGARLGVGSVVEGSVSLVGDEMQLTARLVRIADGASLWSARYDRQLEDLFETQRQLAGDVSESIRQALGIQDPWPHLIEYRDVPEDVRAYKLLRQSWDTAFGPGGSIFTTLYDSERQQQAIELARRATEIDPGYASAQAVLGHRTLGLLNSDLSRAVEIIEFAGQQAANALALDPDNKDAMVLMSAITYRERRWEEGLAWSEAVIDSEPLERPLLSSHAAALERVSIRRR